MNSKFDQLLSRQTEINDTLAGFEARELTDAEKMQVAALEREYKKNNRELDLIARQQNRTTESVDANTAMREIVKAVREHRLDGDIVLKRAATNAISSSVIQSGEKTNMVSAGLPVDIMSLINPLEMPVIYSQLGLKVATGVRGQIQWPCLDTAAECSVGGELDDAATKTLDFSKITATPFKLGISIKVSNEAVNDAAFDLVGTISEQMRMALARTINARVLALSAPTAGAGFVGPLVAKKQTATFAAAVPTYAELKAIKGKVLATGAQMAGFCYVMDAAMYSALEAQPKDTGSGRFVIENGKIDGDAVFVTDLAAYAGKIVAGCFGYEALNQHGEAHFIVDPYTQATKNLTVFTVNADWSLTNLVSGSKYPFVVAAKAA